MMAAMSVNPHFADPPALRIRKLWKHYDGVAVVRDFSLEIQRGEIFGLLGPNGAGKSTSINIVSGVAKLEKGDVQIFGYDNQTHYRQTRRLTGVMHQELVYDPFFTMGTALKIHSGYYGVKDDPKWREQLIGTLALGAHLHKHMNKLSGGMKRRFMVAKALVHKPKLLILDEPTAGVDVELRRALWDFVREINREGTTVLLTTHYIEEAEQMCGRVAIMNKGQLVAVDETRRLMAGLDKKGLIITLREPVDRIPQEVASFNPCLRDQGRLLEFCLPAGTDTGVVLHAMHRAGIHISEVETKTAKLEDVFLNLTTDRAGKSLGAG